MRNATLLLRRRIVFQAERDYIDACVCVGIYGWAAVYSPSLVRERRSSPSCRHRCSISLGKIVFGGSGGVPSLSTFWNRMESFSQLYIAANHPPPQQQRLSTILPNSHSPIHRYILTHSGRRNRITAKQGRLQRDGRSAAALAVNSPTTTGRGGWQKPYSHE